MQIKNKINRLIAGLLIPTVLATHLVIPQTAYAQNIFGQNEPKDPTQITALIAILVEDDLLENTKDYTGFINEYPNELQEQTLKERIEVFLVFPVFQFQGIQNEEYLFQLHSKLLLFHLQHQISD